MPLNPNENQPEMAMAMAMAMEDMDIAPMIQTTPIVIILRKQTLKFSLAIHP